MIVGSSTTRSTPESYLIDISSTLTGVDAGAVWRHVTSWEGVNAELWPLNMTHPDRYPRVSDIPADGRVHMTSTIRLGFVPLDKHRLSFREMIDGEMFDERSSNLLLRQWTHKRSLVPMDDGITVTDSCTLTPRFSFMGGMLAALYRSIFRRRHERLRQMFG